jgi:hypothetical protein
MHTSKLIIMKEDSDILKEDSDRCFGTWGNADSTDVGRLRSCQWVAAGARKGVKNIPVDVHLV